MFGSKSARILLKQFNTCKFLIGEANYAHNARKLKRYKADPGIAARKTLVHDKEEFKELDDHDYDFEADFISVGSAYDQHLNDENLHREKLKYQIVRQRYFKEKLPNFLSWSDKEQIRHLHKTNPEEWTIERLAEGFPALPHVVSKIIAGTWTKTTHQKKINHDKSVEQNWKLFNEGKMKDLPPDVVEHLQKFSDRKSMSMSVDSSVMVKADGRELPKTKSTEFLDIIRSYRKSNENNTEEPVQLTKGNQGFKPQKYSYVENPSKYDKPHTTLDQFTEKLVRKSEKGSIKPNEEFMLKNLEKKQEDSEITESKYEDASKSIATLKSLNKTKYYNSEVSDVVKKPVPVMENYPERIRIPKSLYKPGSTYKLNDCYYDDDGEFLYRVPGMYK